MDNIIVNPYLPSYEYVPDGEPHVFGDRVYLYGSHDAFDGSSFCLLDYVCWSAPIDDLSDWRYEGVIYKRSQDPDGKPGAMHAMYAPDVVKGNDGKYYLYYFLAYHGLICVARCDTPAGKFEYYGHVKYKDGTLLGKRKEPLQFDPGVFKDDDGTIYLFTGFGPANYPFFLLGNHKASKHGPMGFVLDKDMLTIKEGPTYIDVLGKKEGKGTAFEGHEFFEASSMRKFDGKYYFIYSSYQGHELCYAFSDKPLSGFEYGGTLVSNGDVGIHAKGIKDAKNVTGNTHGSLIKIKDKYYVFYHRHTNRNAFSRQACAEQIRFENGKFYQAEMTSCGLQDNGMLPDKGTYEARIACQLYSTTHPMYFSGVFKKKKGDLPYFTQNGKDRDDNPDQYIANFSNGSIAVFKYFDVKSLSNIDVLYKGNASGMLDVFDIDNRLIAQLPIDKSLDITSTSSKTTLAKKGKQSLKFAFEGKGHFDFISFVLS